MLLALYSMHRIYRKNYAVKASPDVVYQNLALRRRNIEVAAIPVVEIHEHQAWLEDVEAFKKQEGSSANRD